MAQCRGKTKRGTRCRKVALSGKKYCYLHRKENTHWFSLTKNVLRNYLWPLITVIATVLTVVGYINNCIDKEIQRTTGEIIPPRSQSVQPEKAKVAIGSDNIILLPPNNVLLTEGGLPLVNIKLINDRLLVSVKLRDKDGELIAELVDNQWDVNPYSSFDRNYTDNIIEIKNKKGEIVLQAVNLGEVIYLACLLHCKSGPIFGLIPDDQSGRVRIVYFPPDEPLEGKLSPLCDYPSDLNLGNCRKLDTIKNTTLLGREYVLDQPLIVCP